MDLQEDAQRQLSEKSLQDWGKENSVECLPPATKRMRKCLSLKKKGEPLKDSNSIRFASPMKTDQLEKAAEGVIPANTQSNTNWAVRTFFCLGGRAKQERGAG